MRSLRLTIILLLCGITATADKYDNMRARADWFFDNSEWASASACYNYMLSERPRVPDTYGRGIVSTLMMGDTVQSQQLLKDAMAYKIPLDTVLSHVRRYAFLSNHSDIYKDFLLVTARQEPWLARPIDAMLLKYYTFRCDGPMIVRYAKTMLAGVPENIQFLSTLAHGYMLCGDYTQAVSTWQKILSIEPDDYDTIINLASYCQCNGDDAGALTYYRRAYDLRPTPYVAQAIAQLTQ